MLFSPELLVLCVYAVWILIQLGFFLLVFSRLIWYKIPDSSPEPEFPVSIIVCAFNEEANLAKNLPILLTQQYHKNGKPYYEVVVVNDNSEDDTIYLLNRLQSLYPHLHVVNLSQEAKLIPGKKFPLSMGIKSAQCEHLLLTDADCTPASLQWLQQMASGFTDIKKIVLGYSPYLRHAGWLNRTIRFETTHTAMQYLSYTLAGIPYMGVGRNLAYQKTLFNINKGFSSHHHVVSGDDDLFINQVARRKNTAICIHPDAFTSSEPKRTQEEWHHQKRRHFSTGRYYKSRHKFLLGLYSLSHTLSWAGLLFIPFIPEAGLLIVSLFLLRWLVQWMVFQRCFTRLHQSDLIPYLLLYDAWLLYYHAKGLWLSFSKPRSQWK